MDTRGYGRAGDATPAQRRVTGALMLAGLVGVCVGVYAVLDSTAPRLLAGPLLGVGLLLAAGGMLSAGRRVQRSVYRPDPWRWPELAVVATGVAVGAAGWWVAREDFLVAHPDATASPAVSTTALLGVLVGLAPAVLAPPPRRIGELTA
jgi:energy-coupling factor transport system permease protein